VEDVVISADADLLRHALLNVVRNALDAMAGGGHLRVSVKRSGDQCEISVSDTGPGIPDELRQRIFEPFYSTKESGSGIGLAMTTRVLQMHGGSVDFESVSGQGTTFCLRLPVAPAEFLS
jgi:signal transduction histidine kinase